MADGDVVGLSEYRLEGTSETDDFDFPAGFLLGFVASGVGFIALLTSGSRYLYARSKD